MPNTSYWLRVPVSGLQTIQPHRCPRSAFRSSAPPSGKSATVSVAGNHQIVITGKTVGLAGLSSGATRRRPIMSNKHLFLARRNRNRKYLKMRALLGHWARGFLAHLLEPHADGTSPSYGEDGRRPAPPYFFRLGAQFSSQVLRRGKVVSPGSAATDHPVGRKRNARCGLRGKRKEDRKACARTSGSGDRAKSEYPIIALNDA